MTHEEAFLQSIIEDPEDDSLRLIYADFLDERGDPRGEFIRVQCALALLPKGDRRRRNLETRERVLLRQYVQEWLGPLRAWVSQWAFQRGFVQSVSLKAETLLKQGDALFRLAPIRELEIQRGGKLGHDLVACPHLARLDSLRVSGLYAADAACFANCRYLGGLTSLDLSRSSVVRTLVASPRLERLERLDLSGNNVTDNGAAALARSPHFSRLRWLDLRWTSITEAGARALAASPFLRRLVSLQITGYWIGEEGKRLLWHRFGDRVHF